MGQDDKFRSLGTSAVGSQRLKDRFDNANVLFSSGRNAASHFLRPVRY